MRRIKHCRLLTKGLLVMTHKLLIKCMLGLVVGFSSVVSYAAPLEGFWRTIDDKTGQQVSIVEIKKKADNTYGVTVVYRYPQLGSTQVLANCVKCPAPFKDKPILGLEISWGIKEDPNKPNEFINGRILEPRTGNIYKGKAKLSPDGKRLRMRGYIGVSLLGRSQVWIRTQGATP